MTLVASPRYPNPVNRGDKIRWQALLRSLSRITPLDAVFGFMPNSDVRDEAFESLFRSVRVIRSSLLEVLWNGLRLELSGRPSVFGRLATREWTSSVRAAASTSSGALLLGVNAAPIGDLAVPAVFDLIDVSSRLRTTSGDGATQTGRLAMELSLAKRFRVLFACEDDRQWLIQHGADGSRIVVIPNGVDPVLFRAVRGASSNRLLFVGNFNYAPNREGARWFLRRCWPALRRDHVSLRIVGYAADRFDRYRPSIEVFANAPEMLPHYESGAIAIAPLRSAIGVQNKVIEAMAAGLPVVCTSPVARGLASGHPAIVADGSAEFVEACRALVSEPARQTELGNRGREYARRSHDWDVSARLLADVLTSAT